ncbi:hypothetical protein OSSY52_12240 [Tepiditoga spiralis]|uniref:Serine aminopeptidase S33 domain-containing protein n=1 Tax=Tepiditoga spiralis TaxID=2108365 RepID=A0A7G1G849_9BACT|nr:alpha/beta fold hydrolase [Tepiditoga spiralis]BBE31083.1 hypothetical protein OSSY52_12240 [Tepiditoga spiralis]
MFFDNIPKETSINKISQPSFFEGGEEAVLLIHGYTGTPHDMRYLGHMLHKAGFTVSIPRLPGHGTNSIDFQNSNWKDWLRKVTDEYIDLKYKYKEVYISGLSMGGVLTLILASKFKPKKIALAAPAIEAKNKKIKITPFLKYFIKKLIENIKKFMKMKI